MSADHRLEPTGPEQSDRHHHCTSFSCIALSWRAMGMGDLKLAAAVGAWIGPAQFFTASIFTAFVGGVLAVGWALWTGSLGASLECAGDLLMPWQQKRPKPDANGRKACRNSIPYAPAIAIGTLLSFLAR